MKFSVKAVYPDKVYRTAEVLAAMDKEQNEIIKDSKRRLEKTTKTWEHRVKFKTRIYRFSTGGKRSGFYLGTDDEVWNWTDQGTKPHIIRPKYAKVLRFPSQFRAKTTPGQYNSRRGFSGGTPRHAMEVHHPGTKARGWTKMEARILRKTYYKRINTAMKRSIYQSGYGY